MKIDEALQAIQLFFNDLIGAVIPGLVLGVGLVFIHKGWPNGSEIKTFTESGFLIVVILALAFAAGHGLLAIYNEILKIIKYEPKTKQFESRRPYLHFKNLIEVRLGSHSAQKEGGEKAEWYYNDLRNVALSISPEGASLGRRFMFISLLCDGVGMALLLLAFDYLVCSLCIPMAIVNYPNALITIFQVLGLVIIGIFYFRRGRTFYDRAMFLPFSIALTALLMKEPKE